MSMAIMAGESVKTAVVQSYYAAVTFIDPNFDRLAPPSAMALIENKLSPRMFEFN